MESRWVWVNGSDTAAGDFLHLRSPVRVTELVKRGEMGKGNVGTDGWKKLTG